MANKLVHHALLSLSIPTPEGTAVISEILKKLPEDVGLVAVSSIYKKYLSGHMDDLNSDLICVLRVETSLSAHALFTQITQCPGDWELLLFDQIVALTPELPIPNPLLFEDAALLRCASETWGEYEHPILGQSLNELVRSVHSFENIEFFAQGRSVL